MIQLDQLRQGARALLTEQTGPFGLIAARLLEADIVTPDPEQLLQRPVFVACRLERRAEALLQPSYNFV